MTERSCRFETLVKTSWLGALCLSIAVSTPHAEAACADASLNVDPLATLSTQVVGFAHAGDQRLFVYRKQGIIQIWDGTQVLAIPFLDIDSLVWNPVSNSDERGLLGLAFHPDYDSNGFFYVNYIDNGSNSVVARFSRTVGDSNIADPASQQIVLTLVQPNSNHNGGALEFGPDGYLYIAFGDGGGSGDSSCNAQNTDRWLGKLLRIDVDSDDFPVDPARNYAIPADNPFVGTAGILDEIWALGLRNPWRMSFDSGTGDLWIGDVGQNLWEEVSYQPSSSSGGENYGWKVMEAHTCFDPDPIDPDCPVSTPSCFDPSYTDPVYSYSHSSGRCTIVGGARYRGSQPDLAGCYVFGDYCSGEIFAFDPDALPGVGAAPVVDSSFGFGLTALGQDAAGELYAALGSQIYRLTNDSIFADGFESGDTLAWTQ